MLASVVLVLLAVETIAWVLAGLSALARHELKRARDLNSRETDSPRWPADTVGTSGDESPDPRENERGQ